MAEDWIQLARLLRPQGRRGEILAEVHTDFPERFSRTDPIQLIPPNGSKETPRTATIEAHWFPVGRNAGRVVLQLSGVASINDAEVLAGWAVALPIEERMPLEEDAAYISDLIGSTLFDGETAVGIVEDVEFPAPAPGEANAPDAPALLRVMRGEEELLIPFVKAWIIQLDTNAKKIVMRLPEGLLDINKNPA